MCGLPPWALQLPALRGQPTQDIKQHYEHALKPPPEPLDPACSEIEGWQGISEHIVDEGYKPSKQLLVHLMRRNLEPTVDGGTYRSACELLNGRASSLDAHSAAVIYIGSAPPGWSATAHPFAPSDSLDRCCAPCERSNNTWRYRRSTDTSLWPYTIRWFGPACCPCGHTDKFH